MEPSLDLRDVVKQRFAFDRWQHQRSLSGAMFVWNVDFRGDELPDVRAERLERLELSDLFEPVAQSATGRSAVSVSSEKLAVAQVHAIWRHTKHPDVLIRVDTFECPSFEDGRELLVWLLGEFESPLVVRKDGIGDVGFSEREDRVLLFARANLVYLLRNIGRRPVPVIQVGAALDANALSRPDTARRAAARMSFAADTQEVVEATLVDLTSERPAEQGTRKFFAPAGEIRIDDRRIVYRGPREALDALTDYSVGRGGTPPRR
jgi:hypothetical protein